VNMTNVKMLPQTTTIVLDEQVELSLAEFCRACAVHAELVIDLVDEGILDPAGPTPQCWRFTGTQLRRARIALRLQHDLGVNLAGAALAVALLEESEALRAQLDVLRGRVE